MELLILVRVKQGTDIWRTLRLSTRQDDQWYCIAYFQRFHPLFSYATIKSNQWNYSIDELRCDNGAQVHSPDRCVERVFIPLGRMYSSIGSHNAF